MDNLNSKLLQVCQVRISIPLIVVMLIFFSLFHNTFAEFEKESRYFDGYGFHILPYNLTSGKMTEIGCSYYGITIKLISEQDGILNLLIPRTFYETQYSTDVDVIFTMINGTEIRSTVKEFEEYRVVTLEYKAGKSDVDLVGTISGSPPPYCKTMPINSKYYELLSPKKQLESGIMPDEVVCRHDFEKIFKPSNSLPVCVKSESKIKLVERGWTESEIFQKTIKVSNSDVILRYNIENSELVEIYTDHGSGSQIFNLKNSQNGQIMVEFPKLNENCLLHKAQWFVLINGKEETDYNMIETRNSIIFLIHFPKNTSEIELIGTSMIHGMPTSCSIIN